MRGRVEFRQLRELQKKIDKLAQADYEQFCEDAAKEIAARLLARVIRRTPVGSYEDGRVGGTLRRGWTANSHNEAESGSSSNVKAYADSLRVIKSGNEYRLEVFNPVEYSAFVEYGYRTRNHKGWVPGRFMMTVSADEIQSAAPKIIEQKLLKLLREAFE